MKSIYKKLGPFIEQVKVNNSHDACQDLRGVRINKEFMPSVANVTGTDLSTYKLVTRGQFAFNPMHVGRDEVLPIAHHTEEEPIIVSPAYVVFEITKPAELLPEYLMMWCRRPEFDRLAWFTTDSSVRGSFSWDDFCNMELPVPSPAKQRAIVVEYQTVVDRIRLNERLNEKLEEAAQAIYRHWFVDFEFPMTAAQARALDKPELEGLPYKSSGGKLVYNEIHDQDIPAVWRCQSLGEDMKSVSKTHDFEKENLIFFNTSDVLKGSFLHSDFSEVASMPGQAKKSIQYMDILYSEIRPINRRYALVRIENPEDYVVSTKLLVLRSARHADNIYRIYCHTTSDWFIDELQKSAEGRSGTFPQITYELDIEKKPLLIADEDTEKRCNQTLKSLYAYHFRVVDETKKLEDLRDVLLSGLAQKLQ